MSDFEQDLNTRFDQMSLSSILSLAQFKALNKVQSLLLRDGDYVPTPIEDLVVLLNQLDKLQQGRLLVDLGSGPGMLPLCASFFNIPSVGIEKDPGMAKTIFTRMKQLYETQLGKSDAESICGDYKSDDPKILSALEKSKYVYAFHWPNDISSAIDTYSLKCPADATLILRVQDNMQQQYHAGIEAHNLTIGRVIRSPSQNASFLLCNKQ